MSHSIQDLLTAARLAGAEEVRIGDAVIVLRRAASRVIPALPPGTPFSQERTWDVESYRWLCRVALRNDAAGRRELIARGHNIKQVNAYLYATRKSLKIGTRFSKCPRTLYEVLVEERDLLAQERGAA